MEYSTTKLIETISKGEDIKEFFRSELEKAINQLLKHEFPEEIRRSTSTNNIVENLNKRIKKITKSKEQFPNEDSLDRTICMISLEYNEKFSNIIHKGFDKVRNQTEEIFDKLENKE